MGFECHHCGACCHNISTQINLSIADIYRIQKYLKQELEEMMPNLGIVPFLSDDNTFDYELGLNKPCQFRKDNRCTIYPARPLNCRMFPYFVLNTDIIDPDFGCLKNERNYTEEEQNQYKKYVRFIGNLILKEAEMTETFYLENNLKQNKKIDLNLPSLFSKKKMMELKIRKALTLVDLDNYNNLTEQLQQSIKLNHQEFITSEEINENEHNIFNRIN